MGGIVGKKRGRPRKAEFTIVGGRYPRYAKPCVRCGVTKTIPEFASHPSTIDRKGSWCTPCHKMYMREYLSRKRAERERKLVVTVPGQCAMPGCEAKISRYNPGIVCGPCERKVAA